jgi:hypothetical protein
VAGWLAKPACFQPVAGLMPGIGLRRLMSEFLPFKPMHSGALCIQYLCLVYVIRFSLCNMCACMMVCVVYSM